VYVDGVRRRRADVSTTTISAADRQRSAVPLRHRGVLDAAEPHVARRRLGRGEVDQGEVDALAAADDDPPRARRRRRRQMDVDRRRRP